MKKILRALRKSTSVTWGGTELSDLRAGPGGADFFWSEVLAITIVPLLSLLPSLCADAGCDNI